MYLVLFVFIMRSSFSASSCNVIKVSFSAFCVLVDHLAVRNIAQGTPLGGGSGRPGQK